MKSLEPVIQSVMQEFGWTRTKAISEVLKSIADGDLVLYRKDSNGTMVKQETPWIMQLE